MRKLRVLCVIFACAGFLGSLGFYGYFKLIAWSDLKLHLAHPQVIDFPSGTKLRTLSNKLAKQGVVNESRLFQLWVRFFADYSKFQAGKYRFEGSVSPNMVISSISRGEVFVPVVLELSIPEGFTVKQTIARLIAKEVGTEQEFASLLSDRGFLKEMNIDGSSLEGYLFPATYRFSEMPSPREVFEKAVQAFWKQLPESYVADVAERGLSLGEAVTFASLIELETPHDNERPFVSEVIWRRLKAKAALGIDAAIIYGIEDYRGNITQRHLRDKKNPYNTRVYAGLPPTPICSPSLSSLEAVLIPSSEGYYYYVLDPSLGNRHHFSKTLREHNRYVRTVQFTRRSRRKAVGK